MLSFVEFWFNQTPDNSMTSKSSVNGFMVGLKSAERDLVQSLFDHLLSDKNAVMNQKFMINRSWGKLKLYFETSMGDDLDHDHHGIDHHGQHHHCMD